MSDFRHASTGRIDRNRPVRFRFDGRSYGGFRGDTLASALIANGVHLVGRSFKYHRPRGFVSAGSEEPNALVGVGDRESRYTPNLRATQVEITEGLVSESQNRWPSLEHDVGAVNGALGRFLSAGFYYKTFMWPPKAWERVYEPMIRRAAGLGRAPTAPDADRYAQRFSHCEVLVVGAGPAGLAAALAASEDAGTRVILCDEQAEMGGSLLHESDGTIDGQPPVEWAERSLAELSRRPNVTLLPRTTAFGFYPHNMLGLAERLADHRPDASPDLPRERMWQVRAGRVVFATGSIERPLVFPGNDRPGILLAESARVFARRYGALVGRRVVVATAGDSAYRAALDLHALGVEIAAIADLRESPDGPFVEAARQAGIRILTDTAVTGTAGRLRVSSATLTRRGDWSGEDFACDALLMSGGWTPTISLFSQSRGKMRWDEGLKAYVPAESVEAERSAGACRGVFDLAGCLRDGWAAGANATEAALPWHVDARDTGHDGFRGECPHPHDPREVKSFVDFQNDVTAKDVRLATQEGFRSIEHVKRYTTSGMATDQGRLSNINTLAVVSKELKRPEPAIGLTTFRPPYTPTSFGLFAGTARGELFDPVRRTPIHDWAAENGAAFEDVSLWKRAHYFPCGGEDMHAAVARECRAVRASVGLFDASTLGKIEVVGPDAAEFIDRLYTNPFRKLAVGSLRYGVLLREDGFVMDDGVVARISEDRFQLTTTTGGAPRVLHHMEDYLQTEWPHLDVWLTSVTEEWATIAVQGPNARAVLEPLVEGIDLSASAMPHMTWRAGTIAGGVPTRLWRVSFTGELGFEVNVPAGYGRQVWEQIVEAGRPFDITPYGTETMHVLRAEKGYIIIGQETDGTAVPDDVGLAWAVAKKKHDFVGMRSLARPALQAANRKQMVGLLTRDPAHLLEEGAQVVPHDEDVQAFVPDHALGHVTSSYRSQAVGRTIALALVEGGRGRIGETVDVPMPSGRVPATIVDPVFYDRENERLHA
ncbi:sarcosine oxidase subunit alpha family protein [Aureimonas jatrophae]|uniref:Sarcosine oxidase subunit alpha n=1 Tax=Aureimonas jatrophae TaxID=1166073 RepID=A0A1H0DCK3_9HYPH|nr:sarcosine oxidase subunit alpha family protein [Aureimonas jatrophae]MBB3951811.1 sarcosine oxidase subunit alpha [Aureimonas jatrophae]SDN67749.1 sarcosine oxidase subunit alpha [Aureimonas jatrophae]